MWFCVNFSYYGAFIWLPSLLVASGLTWSSSFGYTLVITLAQLPGYAVAALLIELWGRRPTLAAVPRRLGPSARLFGTADGDAPRSAPGMALSFFNLGAWGALYARDAGGLPDVAAGHGHGLAAGFGRIASDRSRPLSVPWLLDRAAPGWCSRSSRGSSSCGARHLGHAGTPRTGARGRPHNRVVAASQTRLRQAQHAGGMNQHDPTREQDDTQPVPVGASAPGYAGQTHRYGEGHPGYEHTAAYDTRTWGTSPGQPGGPYFGGPGPQAPSPFAGRPGRSTISGGLVAGILAAALVVGGAAGIGGAAGYDALTADSTGAQTSPVVNTDDTPAKAGSVEAVASSVLPSVVKINVQGAQGAGSGSGVVISTDGEILTNNHVVELAQQGGRVSVAFNDGKTAPAEVVGTDPLTDLAIIKAQGVSGLTPATLGESGNLDVGEQVVAIGSPFGLEATVTSGIVSALHRPVSIADQGSSIDTAYPAIQTDAAINPGNSGGPLVNMQGQVVGINSSIRSASSSMEGQGGSIGLGFAIPLDQAMPVVEQLRAGETPTHARLGVSVTNAATQDGLVTGAGIAEVSAGSAADKAGLQRGDIVVKVGDQPVQDSSSLVATIRGHRPGDSVTLTVVRDGDQQQVKTTLDSDKGAPAS